MFKSASLAMVVLSQLVLFHTATLAQTQPKMEANTQAKTQPTLAFQNIGRTATAQEVKAWDIDVGQTSKASPRGKAQ